VAKEWSFNGVVRGDATEVSFWWGSCAGGADVPCRACATRFGWFKRV
jgi:hypothetical protein